MTALSADRALLSAVQDGRRHPNEIDLKRIEYALLKRARYRYVSVSVLPEENGYRIVSPCCSRTIDPNGGDIDIALMKFDESANMWKLFSKNHMNQVWFLHLRAETICQLLECLNEDPAKLFWQ